MHFSDPIEKTLRALFRCADSRDWEGLKPLLAPHLLLDYSAMSGQPAEWLTPEQISEHWQAALSGFLSTHHQIGHLQSAAADDQAAAKWRGIALHYLPVPNGLPYWVVVGDYQAQLLLDAQGQWRVEHLTFTPQQQGGNLSLLSTAMGLAPQATVLQPPTAQAKDLVQQFFSSLERRELDDFLSFWAEDAQQLMPLAPADFPPLLSGKASIGKLYRQALDMCNGMNYRWEVYPTERPDRVVVQYESEIPLKDGGVYENLYVGLFTFQDGKLQQLVECFDPEPVKRTFGRR